MTIASALPFSIILLVATYGLIKALRVDIAKKESLQYNVTPFTPSQTKDNWDTRLSNIIKYPSKTNVKKFIQTIAKPAFIDIETQLRKHDLDATIKEDDKNEKITLIVNIGEEGNFGENKNFIYEVRLVERTKPNFAQDEKENSLKQEEELYYCAEVHLIEGGQDYDIMGWSKEGVRNDIVDHYQKHMHFIHLLS